MAITAATLRLQQEVRDQVDEIVDQQTRDLVSAWVDAWEEVAPDLTATLLELLLQAETGRVTRRTMLRSARLSKSLAAIKKNLETLASDAGVRIVGDLQDVIDQAGAAQAQVINSQLPDAVMSADDLAAWSRVDEAQISAMVKRTTEQIYAKTKPIPADQYRVVRRELIRGIAAGKNPRDTAYRIVKRVEGHFNGGLNRAMVISRTETLDAHREAARLGRTQHADVLASWTWMCAMDVRTCASCWAQHGSVHPVTTFGPDDHPQGRCTALPTTKSWAELGIDLPEPPSVLPNAADKFNGLDPEDQKAILGPKRYDAWTKGEYPMDSWSQKKTNDGWRDSYSVSPVPSSSSGGRASINAA